MGVGGGGGGDKKFVLEERLKRLESQLSEERSERSRAESALSDKDRELSMLTVDYQKVMFKVVCNKKLMDFKTLWGKKIILGELSLKLSFLKEMSRLQLNKSEEELRCESDKVRRAMTTAEKVKEEKSDLSSELSGRDSEITLLKANEKRLVRDLAGTVQSQTHHGYQH